MSFKTLKLSNSILMALACAMIVSCQKSGGDSSSSSTPSKDTKSQAKQEQKASEPAKTQNQDETSKVATPAATSPEAAASGASAPEATASGASTPETAASAASSASAPAAPASATTSASAPAVPASAASSASAPAVPASAASSASAPAVPASAASSASAPVAPAATASSASSSKDDWATPVNLSNKKAPELAQIPEELSTVVSKVNLPLGQGKWDVIRGTFTPKDQLSNAQLSFVSCGTQSSLLEQTQKNGLMMFYGAQVVVTRDPSFQVDKGMMGPTVSPNFTLVNCQSGDKAFENKSLKAKVLKVGTSVLAMVKTSQESVNAHYMNTSIECVESVQAAVNSKNAGLHLLPGSVVAVKHLVSPTPKVEKVSLISCQK